ncbi:MAG: ferritin [Planctomycetota bacterium]|nr:MAG: ferritin [Planctomycetota bacterium]
MLTKKMQNALNDQINAEFYSAYLYLSMQAYFQSLNLPGFANWMSVQTREELTHAMKFYDFVNECAGRVILKAINQPQTNWKSSLAAFEAAYKHEQMVTGRISNLVNLAIKEKDHATNSFLQWFVNEQVEEEASVNDVVQKLKMTDDAPGRRFLIDRELGHRVFTPPIQAEGE